MITCPHCFYQHRYDHEEHTVFNEPFFRHPVDMIQEGAGGWTKSLFACPKCGKAFIEGVAI